MFLCVLKSPVQRQKIFFSQEEAPRAPIEEEFYMKNKKLALESGTMLVISQHRLALAYLGSFWYIWFHPNKPWRAGKKALGCQFLLTVLESPKDYSPTVRSLFSVPWMYSKYIKLNMKLTCSMTEMWFRLDQITPDKSLKRRKNLPNLPQDIQKNDPSFIPWITM